jgi:tetratricopeptide (TPR) repeat protein
MLGNRDLAVVCLDRYMEHDLACQESAEMQVAVARVEEEPADMPDVRRRGQVWDRIAAASQAVEKGEALVATASQRVYGTGNRGVRMKTGDDRSSPERHRASQLTHQGVEVIRSGRPDEAMPLFERALAYIANQLTYYNMAAVHLLLGNRDLTLDYLGLLQQRLPRLRESADFQLLMGDIGAAPPEIDAATADGLRTRLAREYDLAISSAPRPPVRTEMRDEP